MEEKSPLREALLTGKEYLCDNDYAVRRISQSLMGDEYALAEITTWNKYIRDSLPGNAQRPHYHYGRELLLINMQKPLAESLKTIEYHAVPHHETFTNLAIEETSDLVVVKFDWDLGGGKTPNAFSNVDPTAKGSCVQKYQWVEFTSTKQGSSKTAKSYRLVKL
ncbi:MAG: hypothetical protein QF858_01340 [Candidatus Pacebacteria bacterium]|nr:hypothetical protein [Candidatus Paceibacterota bacterium]